MFGSFPNVHFFFQAISVLTAIIGTVHLSKWHAIGYSIGRAISSAESVSVRCAIELEEKKKPQRERQVSVAPVPHPCRLSRCVPPQSTRATRAD